MADETYNSSNNADILSALMNQNAVSNDMLRSIDVSLKKMLSDSNKISSANARNRGYSDPFGRNMLSGLGGRRGGLFNSFTDALGEELINQLVGTDFRKSLGEIRDKLAKDMGVAFEDIPATLGKQAAKNIFNAFKDTKTGNQILESIQSGIQKATTKANSSYIRGVENYMRKSNSSYNYSGAFKDLSKILDATKSSKSAAKVAKAASSAQSGAVMMEDISSVANLSQTLGGVAEGAVGAEGALAGLTSAAGGLLPIIPLAIAGFKFQMMLTQPLRDLAKYLTGPAIDGLKKSVTSVTAAMNRYETSQKRNLELAQQRIKADVETMVKYPFEILNRAAEEWYNAWDNNLKTISATQGYTKADVQALATSFAERLRDEGLSSVISSTDIMNNLTKVLESGLSGAAAEEFAYLATVLSETVPTQDFFSYASDYASIAANAVAQGKSQSEALKEANAQLTSFANNILYASRATGGLTTGLKDAESLFKQSVQISQAAKTNSSSGISGVMATIAAVTGAIAPDLAQSLTDAVYKAATGGNASEIVALRSLAGINASNTEFLRRLSKNPQQVFGAMFTKLAQMQNMSNDAFMEVAEGLSSVFGISMDAFARVDFNALAEAIKDFNSSSGSLSENLALLKSGQTTTTAEQLKMQEINEMILNEGLSYVLDNEAAREIQKHMWDEQIAREIMESEYAVDLTGSSLALIQGLAQTVDNILAFITGKWLTNKIVNIVQTTNDIKAQREDLKTMLNLGKVGSGNTASLSQLTRTNTKFDLVSDIVTMMGGQSGKYRNDLIDAYNSTSYLSSLIHDNLDNGRLDRAAAAYVGVPSYNRRATSKYSWGTIGKSTASTIFSSPSAMTTAAAMTEVSATAAAQAKVANNISRMLEGMSSFAEGGGSYDEWVATARRFGISNFTEALESAGYSATQIKGQYEMVQTQMAAKEEIVRKQKEETFWKESTESLLTISDTFKTFLSDWEDYFINHTVYSQAYTRDTVDKILREEREGSESAIYALADALTENNVDLLVDPTLQTNALLSQILKVANAILNQTSTGGGGVSLPDTLAGLSLGLFNQ